MSSIPPVGPTQAALLLQPDAGLAARLALGQVVRAQVLEHQAGNRYLMRILGQTTVAESAVALRAGDVFHGRVVGLQDRIELERVEAPAAQPVAEGDEALAGLGAGRSAEVIEELFRRYRGTLDARDAQALERLVARASRPDRMALAGLILRKLGLALDSQLLESLFETLGKPAGALAPIGGGTLVLGVEEKNTEGVDPLAEALGRAMQPAPAHWPPAQWVLNAQGGGTVSHQLGVLPLELGGTAIEVEFALFEEGEGREAPGLRHRKLVLAFDTETLGRVEARAVTAGEHVRVALATESSAATNALLRYGEALARTLAGAGWQVDELSHETRARPESSAPVAAAVDHIITPGSVNRVL
jgi:hypothetical protein